jgi:hypothetical protein
MFKPGARQFLRSAKPRFGGVFETDSTTVKHLGYCSREVITVEDVSLDIVVQSVEALRDHSHSPNGTFPLSAQKRKV